MVSLAGTIGGGRKQRHGSGDEVWAEQVLLRLLPLRRGGVDLSHGFRDPSASGRMGCREQSRNGDPCEEAV